MVYSRRMNLSRRDFLGAAAASAAAFSFPNLRAAAASPNGKVNMAFVGIGHQAKHDFNMFAYYKDMVNVVAFCDTQMGAEHTLNVLKAFPDVPRYQDFRKMLDEHGREIDAVCIAIPDFAHFPAAMLAMSMGKAVYCEKPMGNCFREIGLMTAAAKRHKVVTQMGNQGHSDANYWQMKALVASGFVKDVTHVDAYMCANNRRWFKWKGTLSEMPGEEAEPAEMDWDVWLAQRPFRPFNHNFINGDWRCFYEYGTGALGDWGAHLFDAAHEFLKLGLPTRIEPVKNDRRTPVVFPMASTIRYVFPARGEGLPACTLTWHDGAGNFPAPVAGVTDRTWRRRARSRRRIRRLPRECRRALAVRRWFERALDGRGWSSFCLGRHRARGRFRTSHGPRSSCAPCQDRHRMRSRGPGAPVPRAALRQPNRVQGGGVGREWRLHAGRDRQSGSLRIRGRGQNRGRDPGRRGIRSDASARGPGGFRGPKSDRPQSVGTNRVRVRSDRRHSV